MLKSKKHRAPYRPYYCVREIAVLDGYKHRLTFEDGKAGVFDFTPYLTQPFFSPLKDIDVFSQVTADGETVVWRKPAGAAWSSSAIDFAPETLYENCIAE